MKSSFSQRKDFIQLINAIFWNHIQKLNFCTLLNIEEEE
jgi:hypothetical protein